MPFIILDAPSMANVQLTVIKQGFQKIIFSQHLATLTRALYLNVPIFHNWNTELNCNFKKI